MKHPFILLASILTLSHAGNGAIIVPEPSFGNNPSGYQAGYEVDPADMADFAAKDLQRIVGNTVRSVARKSPYVDVLPGGTIEPNISDEQRAVVQEMAVLNQSLVRPVFVNSTAVCGTSGNSAEVGSTEYIYRLQTLRGKGPLVCIKGAWSAVKTAYSAAEDSLKKQIVQLNNSDIRATLVDRSGCKLVVNSGATFEKMFDGTMQAIDKPFTNQVGLPNAMPTMKLIQYTAQVMREDLLVEGFEGRNGDTILKLIGGNQLIDFLRDDANVRDDMRYIAAGTYDVGKNTLTRYTWEGPYRGIGMGIDPQPLRFNTLNAQGQPVFIEPEIGVETDNGFGSRPNPSWMRAKFEIALLMGQNSFRKLTPDSFTGEGTFKWPSQTATGTLMWRNIEDNDSNVWRDFGRHFFQFERAYRPERPHAVCAIAFARDQTNFGLTPITNFGDWSSTASL